MWKVGDKIQFIKEGNFDSKKACGFSLGKIYKIIEVCRNNSFYLPISHLDESRSGYRVITDNGLHWWIEPDCFKLFKKELKTEVDYLDAFQENFKWE